LENSLMSMRGARRTSERVSDWRTVRKKAAEKHKEVETSEINRNRKECIRNEKSFVEAQLCDAPSVSFSSHQSPTPVYRRAVGKRIEKKE